MLRYAFPLTWESVQDPKIWKKSPERLIVSMRYNVSQRLYENV